jgi:hypothetical protein
LQVLQNKVGNSFYEGDDLHFDSRLFEKDILLFQNLQKNLRFHFANFKKTNIIDLGSFKKECETYDAFSEKISGISQHIATILPQE